MIDSYFDYINQGTKYNFTFYHITPKAAIDSVFIDEIKDKLLTTYRDLDMCKMHLHGKTETDIKQYVLDYMIPGTGAMDKIVRQGDWGEILAALMVSHFQGLAIPINKIQWKFNKNKSVFGTDLIAFNAGEPIEQIYYYEIKTRQNSHKLEGKGAARNYVTIIAHNTLIKDEAAPNEMIADFLMKLHWEKGDYATAQKFSDIVTNPGNYERKFELFFIVEEKDFDPNIFDELNNLPPQLDPLCATVLIVNNLGRLIDETWHEIETRMIHHING